MTGGRMIGVAIRGAGKTKQSALKTNKREKVIRTSRHWYRIWHSWHHIRQRCCSSNRKWNRERNRSTRYWNGQNRDWNGRNHSSRGSNWRRNDAIRGHPIRWRKITRIAWLLHFFFCFWFLLSYLQLCSCQQQFYRYVQLLLLFTFLFISIFVDCRTR